MSRAAEDWARAALAEANAKGVHLTSSERLLLSKLAWHHNATTEACYPSMTTLGTEVGVSDRRARTIVRKLEDLGLIKSTRRCGQGKNSSNQYGLFGTLVVPAEKIAEKTAAGQVPVRNSGSDKRFPEDQTLNGVIPTKGEDLFSDSFSSGTTEQQKFCRKGDPADDPDAPTDQPENVQDEKDPPSLLGRESSSAGNTQQGIPGQAALSCSAAISSECGGRSTKHSPIRKNRQSNKKPLRGASMPDTKDEARGKWPYILE
jgi:hypothetical protein